MDLTLIRLLIKKSHDIISNSGGVSDETALKLRTDIDEIGSQLIRIGSLLNTYDDVVKQVEHSSDNKIKEIENKQLQVTKNIALLRQECLTIEGKVKTKDNEIIKLIQGNQREIAVLKQTLKTKTVDPSKAANLADLINKQQQANEAINKLRIECSNITKNSKAEDEKIVTRLLDGLKELDELKIKLAADSNDIKILIESQKGTTLEKTVDDEKLKKQNERIDTLYDKLDLDPKGKIYSNYDNALILSMKTWLKQSSQVNYFIKQRFYIQRRLRSSLNIIDCFGYDKDISCYTRLGQYFPDSDIIRNTHVCNYLQIDQSGYILPKITFDHIYFFVTVDAQLVYSNKGHMYLKPSQNLNRLYTYIVSMKKRSGIDNIELFDMTSSWLTTGSMDSVYLGIQEKPIVHVVQNKRKITFASSINDEIIEPPVNNNDSGIVKQLSGIIEATKLVFFCCVGGNIQQSCDTILSNLHVSTEWCKNFEKRRS